MEACDGSSVDGEPSRCAVRYGSVFPCFGVLAQGLKHRAEIVAFEDGGAVGWELPLDVFLC